MAVMVTGTFVCFSVFFLSFSGLLNANISKVFLLLDQVVILRGCCMMFAGILMNVLHVSGGMYLYSSNSTSEKTLRQNM